MVQTFHDSFPRKKRWPRAKRCRQWARVFQIVPCAALRWRWYFWPDGMFHFFFAPLCLFVCPVMFLSNETSCKALKDLEKCQNSKTFNAATFWAQTRPYLLILKLSDQPPRPRRHVTAACWTFGQFLSFQPFAFARFLSLLLVNRRGSILRWLKVKKKELRLSVPSHGHFLRKIRNFPDFDTFFDNSRETTF